jgi:MYXO-CTERM domain-containing protein
VKFEDGRAALSPLRFHYDSEQFTLPIRLGLANSSGTQDLIVNILAPHQRYEVANYANVTIPTNLDVKDSIKDRFGAFYAALFDATLAKTPGAVVTEYAWQANSCDPCPGPVLDPNDLATFGADVIGQRYKNVDAMGWVLTRLHARYGRDLANDLVFRAVDPIIGGRGIPDEHGEVSTEVVSDSSNNFQGRYIILHPWKGAISCAAPRRGVWGEPPSQQIATQTASNLAFVPRGKVELASLLAKDVPQIGVLASKPLNLPQPLRQPQGCGCRAQGGGGSLIGVATIAFVVLRRRRRRC